MAAQKSWIENTFKKKECAKFIGSKRAAESLLPRTGSLVFLDQIDEEDPKKTPPRCPSTVKKSLHYERENSAHRAHERQERCGCGRSISLHSELNQTSHIQSAAPKTWDSRFHTRQLPTDAYGVLEFQGAGHGNKAKYIRLSDTTNPEQILKLLTQDWNLGLPNLLISIKGGLQNFEIQPKLKRVFSKGLRKAARTTGAWIITKGTHTGVTLHVGDALNNHSVKMRDRIVTIGISPWGVLNNRESLIGRDTTKPYHSVTCPISKGFKLNSHHTHFLLVDNGTTGQYGSEVVLRRRFEKYISQQKISPHRRVPVVCMVVEGGPTTIRTVLANVTGHPPIPVVVFDGTGRAADIIAFTHKYTDDDGTLNDYLKDQLLSTIRQTFNFNQQQTEKLFVELMLCMKRKELITVFCLSSEGTEEIDLAILSALLKAQARSYADQLSLALTWDRVDIAKRQIFVHGRDWADGVLEQVMMDALMNNRVDFVQLLKDNGVNMNKFLTVARLEELYNSKLGPPSILPSLIKDVAKTDINKKYTLFDIGMVEENLMGGMYQSTYTSKKYKGLFPTQFRRGISFAVLMEKDVIESGSKYTMTFDYPFNELFIWAVLMKRHEMALYMWKQDEEALAKALVGGMLNKAMAKAADVINLDQEIGDELRKFSAEFQNLAVELLEHCYGEDDDVTIQLLTVQLDNWSKQTCLSLAAATQHREFVAHTCCQALLSDLWLGGLQMQKYINLRVIAGLLCPPAIALLTFKTREELQLMPQTLEEHIADLQEGDSDSISDKLSLSGFNQFEDDDDADTGPPSVSDGMLKHDGVVISLDGLQSPSSTQQTTTQRKQLRIGKKLYEFYTAPITKFWMHSMAFVVFLALYNYVVLVRMDPMPNIEEWIVIAYIVTLGVEHIRQLLVSEPPFLGQRIRVFYAGYWNLHDILSITFFMVGLVLRFIPSTHSAGRVIYCVDIVMWYLKLLDLLSVNIYLGPFVNMIGKMMRDMCYFIVLLVIVMMSFGVVRQSILHPDQDPSWVLLRDIFLEPYFMIYGEVYAHQILTPCNDPEKPCPPGHWVVPAAMAVYLVVSIILMVSLLIAVFNNTFALVNPIARQLWKFQRYDVTMNYEQKPLLVPPLVLFHHIIYLFKFLVCRCKRFRRQSRLDRGLKLFLQPTEVEQLHDFEEGCLELYFRMKNMKFESSTEERIRVMYDRVEENCYRIQEVVEKENLTKMNLRSMDMRLLRLEELCLRTNRAVLGLQYLLSENLTSTAESKDGSMMARSPLSRRLPEDEFEEHQRTEAEARKGGEEAHPKTSDRPHPKVSRAFSESTAEEIKRLARPLDLDVKSHADADSSLYKQVMEEEPEPSSSQSKEPVFRFKELQATPDSKNGDMVDGNLSKHSSAGANLANLDRKTLNLDKDTLMQQEAGIQTSPARSRPRSPKSPRKHKVSTFEKYASMVGMTPIPLKDEHKPIKRQVGLPTSTSMYQFANGTKFPSPSEVSDKGQMSRLLGLGMRSRDSESNLSTYSASSFYSNPMPKTMPYASAPAYTSIMDHIDTSLVDKNWVHELNTSGSAGYLPSMEHANMNLDLGLDAIPLSPNTSLHVDLNQFTSKMSPLSEMSDGYGRLQQAEQTEFEMMGSMIDGTIEDGLPDISPDHSSSGGIEFTVRKRADTSAVANHRRKSKETEF
ncbi:transient receptor potential cation channel subfamily M member 3-like isoform X2 [Amphiura filiformis]|uniref:transient receptor potential cation channel subfamily M member 3-like isoform X2 n=1 Tax=Amphiura filiformis TaxID=82378 RepID=UPI003B20FD5E